MRLDLNMMVVGEVDFGRFESAGIFDPHWFGSKAYGVSLEPEFCVISAVSDPRGEGMHIFNTISISLVKDYIRNESRIVVICDMIHAGYVRLLRWSLLRRPKTSISPLPLIKTTARSKLHLSYAKSAITIVRRLRGYQSIGSETEG